MKTCKRCGESKPLDEFNHDRAKRDGRYPSCRPCQRSDATRRRQANLDSTRARERESSARYRAAHPDRRRRSARDWARRDRLANPVKHRVSRNARRVSVSDGGDPVAFTDELLQHWDSLNLHSCVYCGSPYEETDHILPVALGGSHTVENLVPACTYCNRRKHAHDPYAWIPARLAELREELATHLDTERPAHARDQPDHRRVRPDH